ncbi:uncharacterized protein LOC129720607 [Wyeomyia smithii]|uniref:uncharacterized protein LOC129720607 n=1 Tax=Wyeomyia smithii TaxID=174621 RepID=UPI002467FC18|nr:uncharacterized protein LOC129720607 [Wyeomyia smithii]
MPAAASTTKKVASLKSLQAKLKGLHASFNNIVDFVSNYPEDVTASQLSVRLEHLAELWEKIGELVAEVESHEDFVVEDDAFAKERLDFENRYFHVKSSLLDKTKELQDPPVQDQSSAQVDNSMHVSSDHVRLPQIKLQTFDGNIDEWLSFRDLFTSLIHWKVELPDVEKLHYLKGCLQGEAKALIDPLKITRGNYQIAWETLLKRYNNSKLLKKRQIQSLLKLPSVAKESAVELHTLLESFERVIHTLDQIVQPNDYKDLLLVNILSSRLDPSTRRSWEEHSASKEQDTLNDLTDFLQRRVQILESLPSKFTESKRESSPTRKRIQPFRVSHNAVQTSTGKCSACPENHWLYTCPTFQKMSVASRESLLRTQSLCRNCFKRGHQAKSCSSKYSCRKCKGRHHTLVCFQKNGEGEKQRTTEEPGPSRNNAVSLADTSTRTANTSVTEIISTNFSQKRSTNILLATAVVLVEDDEGLQYPARALLDSGSECNFISEQLRQMLKVSRERVDIAVLGVGQASTRVTQRIAATVHSRVSEFSRKMEFLVLPRVTVSLPITTVQISEWKFPEGIHLADPAFFQSKCVDLVLGIQAFFSFFRTGNEFTLGDGLPRLTESVFGWVVSGEIQSAKTSSCITCNLAVSDTLEQLMERFWACEDMGNCNNYSPEEARCEEQFGRTTRRESDGRYTVSLPKDESTFSLLGMSKDIALKRFQGLERRLDRDTELRKQYETFMMEYSTLGHMKRVETGEQAEVKRCYLPHHPVVKASSTTTRVRVVFDASCKTSTGISLNDALLIGPMVQRDLRSIILRSRTRQVMIVADVEKMFRQINMDQADAPLQSILWRFNRDDEIATYELSTVTYGTKPAPFLATRTLKQLAMDESERFPLAAQATEEDTYMDDVISGADDIDTAVELRRQLVSLFESGGFRLRKWISNHERVLEGIPNENLALPNTNEVNLDHESSVMTLGLTWLPKTDCFRFQFAIPALLSDQLLTKRKILSIIASLFDPLGLLGATIVRAKIFMQGLWHRVNAGGKRLEWDEILPATVGEEWRIFHSQLPTLNTLRVPRCVVVACAVSTEIHCFSDASERAYGTCLYLRSTDKNGNYTVHLLTSKSRVAPLNVQSLPRLELRGALLAAQLVDKVLDALKGTYRVHLWTDSTCVLQWIKVPPSTWTTFVANRVSKIQALSEKHNWNHVPGISNPADLISRGILPNALEGNRLWWEGPDWLKKEREEWPNQPDIRLDTISERRQGTVICVASDAPCFSTMFVSKFSAYSRLIRATAYWLRFIAIYVKRVNPKPNGFLTTVELRRAEAVIIRRIQEETFSEELKALTNNKALPRKSPLRWFNPMIDLNGVLRVGGRLGHSQETHDTRHPMILPWKHEFTTMLFRHYHQTLLHAGPQLLLSSIRSRYWPLGGRKTARMVVHQCQRCFRAKPTLLKQQMGELPTARVTVARPVSRTGVDYFGPVHIRDGRKRPAIKAYVAVFVCMCTKAVHMELVTDLSTERFLQALRRFISRRGRCTDLYSDNGTNFVGARNQLKELRNSLRDKEHQEKVSKECAQNGMQWHFNPPSAPHFGGLWEAAVRSAKHHLLRVLGENPIAFEDFNTLLIQVEGCLNSRPLTPLSDDPSDMEALTPGHFLTGGSLQAIPEPDYTDVKLNRLSRWQLVQWQLQNFWKRWRTEYLSQLQGRTKNWEPPSKVEIGRLVIIVDSNQPPMRWKMGRIHKLHPGPDDVVRVVTVKTATGYLQRPIVKLCILPSPETENSADSTSN